jgi:hypothetical protein
MGVNQVFLSTLTFLVVLAICLSSCQAQRAPDGSPISPMSSPSSLSVSSSTASPVVISIPAFTLTSTLPAIETCTQDASSDNALCTIQWDEDEYNGWDCINTSYGFSIHFPYAITLWRNDQDIMDFLLFLEPEDTIDRQIEVQIQDLSGSCLAYADEEIQIGDNLFRVSHFGNPSGTIYIGTSFAAVSGETVVCIAFIAGFGTFPEDGRIFPSDEEQRIVEIYPILESFHWLDTDNGK